MRLSIFHTHVGNLVYSFSITTDSVIANQLIRKERAIQTTEEGEIDTQVVPVTRMAFPATDFRPGIASMRPCLPLCDRRGMLLCRLIELIWLPLHYAQSRQHH